MNIQYKTNNKINLYKENLIKFIISQKNKIIQIGSIGELDYLVGILFLTETNRYFKLNNISVHSYYLAFAFINIFIKIKNKMFNGEIINSDNINHWIESLANNIDYLNARIDSSNSVKNKINNNLAKFILEILPILNNLCSYNKIHNSDNQLAQNNKYCDINCYECWVYNILSKFFYVLLITAKFIGTGIFIEPNLIRLAEYYANIFYSLFKSYNYIHSIEPIDSQDVKIITELYENYLNYKNKLNYSIIELKLQSDTIDEIIKYLDNQIIKILSIKIK